MLSAPHVLTNRAERYTVFGARDLGARQRFKAFELHNHKSLDLYARDVGGVVRADQH